MTRENLSKIVHESLQKHTRGFGNYRFEVVLDSVYQDEEQLWHVPIRPDRVVERRGAFYDLLNDVEKQIEQDHQINVMIVPIRPVQETSASPGA